MRSAAAPVTRPAGTQKRKTRLMNPGTYRREFGAKAKKNPGIPIVNVLDEVSDEPAPGYIEFELDGRKYTLDVVGDDEGLFTIFRDPTAGDTTYASGRFLYIEEKPKPGEIFKLDLNRAYNPPCAFSEFTTCPLPPKQNILKVRIDAGEKYPPRRQG